ncbi:MAG: hypothetical protein OXB89_05205 [Anaerolineaceae bacterium]|nr:hypothetical protein [Anaerolineaceae bacterium]
MPRSETGLLRALVPAGPDRRFWLIVGLIIFGGLVLRVLVHDFGLPWFEEIDELRIWFTARIARDMPVVEGPKYDPGSYPPLNIWLHRLAQPLAEAQGRPLAVDAVLDLRRFMLLFNTLGAIWFAMLGRRCGGALAGIIAAALWAFDTDVLEVIIYAIGESLVIPLLMLSILLAAKSLDSPRRWWLAPASMALGALCFLAEYRLLVAIVPGFAALLWQAWRHYRPGWRLILLLSGASLAFGVTASILILERLPPRFQTHAQEALSAYLWDMDAFFLFLERSIRLIHPLTLPLVLLLVLLALRDRAARAAAPLSVPTLLMVTAIMFLTTWATSSIRPYGPDSLERIWPRHLLPATLMLYLLLATTVAQLLSVLRQARIRRIAQALLPAYALLLLLPPALRLVQDYRVLSWPVIVRNWVDDNLEASNILVYQHTERWFSPVRSRMPHRVWFNWWKVDDIREKPLQQWIDDYHLTWALIPATIHDNQLRDDGEGQALLDQMLLIRNFTAPPQRRDNESVLYRLWRMQHETDVRFGEHIRLSGYDLHTPDPRPGTDTFAVYPGRGASTGDELSVTLYWNATSAPPENYSFFLHLGALDDPRPLAQVDGNPAVPARLTSTWDRPEETLISPRFSLALPEDLPPGDYRVTLGLYNFETGERLPLRDATDAPLGDAWELLQLSVSQDGSVTVTEPAGVAR